MPKTKTKKPMTRKTFVKLLNNLRELAPRTGSMVTKAFYEMIEPLDREVAELRAEKAKLGKVLDQALTANDALYDRLVLALDGGRPPKGILGVIEALEPFVVLADALLPLAKVYSDDVAVLIDHSGIDCAPLEGREPFLTLGHLRAAAKALAWVRELRAVRPDPATADSPEAWEG